MKTYETLTYINSRGEELVFGIGSKYHVNVSKDVTGISDLQDTIYSTSSMGQHGDTYVGIRIEPRDISIDGKIADADRDTQLRLRRDALKILNPELDGTLYYSYGTFTRKIDAKVDGSPVFTRQDISQEFTVNFKCLSPFWEEENETREDIASWIGDWEFPCEIDKDDDEDMIFGHREENVIVDVYNSGHVSTGMRIVFKALGALSNPMLFNVNTREFIKVNTEMSAGQTITIDTSYGKKSVVLTSSGLESNIYRLIDVDSTFMQLDIGDNVFRYDAASGADNLEVTIYFSPKYLGV